MDLIQRTNHDCTMIGVFNENIEYEHTAGFVTPRTHVKVQDSKKIFSKICICDWENDETKSWIILAHESFF